MTRGQKDRVNAFLGEIREAVKAALHETVPNSIIDVQLSRIARTTEKISNTINGSTG
jgi:hypothetical protein